MPLQWCVRAFNQPKTSVKSHSAITSLMLKRGVLLQPRCFAYQKFEIPTEGLAVKSADSLNNYCHNISNRRLHGNCCCHTIWREILWHSGKNLLKRTITAEQHTHAYSDHTAWFLPLQSGSAKCLNEIKTAIFELKSSRSVLRGPSVIKLHCFCSICTRSMCLHMCLHMLYMLTIHWGLAALKLYGVQTWCNR